MIDPPETRYALCEGMSIAYQVSGQGKDVMVVAPGALAHLEALWSIPQYARMHQRLAKSFRVVRFDRRGIGFSDRLPAGRTPTLQERSDDMLAVMDAVGLSRATVYGASDGGHVAAFVAANHPDRVRSLVLYGAWACRRRVPGYSLGEPEWEESVIPLVEAHWGSDSAPFGVDRYTPSLATDAEWRHVLARAQRLTGSPSTAAALYRSMFATDIRDLLHRISVPTLVLHKTQDRAVSIEHGRFLAAHIPRARLLELPGIDHFWMAGENDLGLNALEEFVTGRRAAQDVGRIIGAILFTDIVASTSTAVALGDRRWTVLLEQHEDGVRREVALHGGRVVDTAGDGVFALLATPRSAIDCALAVQERMRRLDLQIRAGIHTGEVESVGDRVVGLAVHIGARIVAAASAGEILVSRTVRDLVAGSDLEFSDRGAHILKGLPEPWQLYAVVHRMC